MKWKRVFVFCSILGVCWCLAQRVDPSPAYVGETVTYTETSGVLPTNLTVMVGSVHIPAADVTRVSDTQFTFTLPDGSPSRPDKLLGGIYYVSVNNTYKVALTVWGINLPGLYEEDFKERPPSDTPSIETLLFQFCNGPVSQSQIDATIRAAADQLSINGNLMVKVVGPSRSVRLDGNSTPCTCTLTEQDFQLQRNNLGKIVKEMLPVVNRQIKDKQTTLVALSPLIRYSPQGHYGSHPGPDHKLDPPPLGHPSSPWRSVSIAPTTMPEAVVVPIIKSSPNPKSLGTIVAVLDSGLHKDALPLFKTKPLEQWNFDKTPDVPGYAATQDIFHVDSERLLHGTPIARIIGSMARFAQVLPIKVCSDGSEYEDSICTETNVVRGICYALKQAQGSDSKRRRDLVLNLSLSNYNWSPILRGVLSAAVNQGAVVVTVAGNAITPDSPDMAYKQGTVTFPAGYGIDLPVLPSQPVTVSRPSVPGQVLGVAGIAGTGSVVMRKNKNDWEPTNTTIWGKHVTLAAPGRTVLVDGRSYSGTSFAAAFVSGYMASLRLQLPTITPANLVSCITNSSHVAPAANNEKIGRGVLRLNAPFSCP